MKKIDTSQPGRERDVSGSLRRTRAIVPRNYQSSTRASHREIKGKPSYAIPFSVAAHSTRHVAAIEFKVGFFFSSAESEPLPTGSRPSQCSSWQYKDPRRHPTPFAGTSPWPFLFAENYSWPHLGASHPGAGDVLHFKKVSDPFCSIQDSAPSSRECRGKKAGEANGGAAS